MHRSPVHEIEILHNWGPPEPQDSEARGLVTVQTCEDCGAEQHILDLDQVEEGPEPDWQETLDRVRQVNSRIRELFEDMNAALFAGTEYRDGAHFAMKIKRRFEFVVDDDEINYDLMSRLVQAGTKKFWRKIMLAHKQGLVCNRCDAVVHSLDDLTPDEIVPKARGGQSKLLNLQLLHSECNSSKGNSEPDERDQSPYAYQGPSCRHQITCREVAALQASRNAPAGQC